MTALRYKNEADSCIALEAYDGLFKGQQVARCAPYLYLTNYSAVSNMSFVFECDEFSAEKLRKIADQVEAYWKGWVDSQQPQKEEETDAA